MCLRWSHFACKTRFALTALALLSAFIFIGCGRNEENTTPPANSNNPSSGTSATPISDLKVALVTPGPVSDAGWNAGAYKGLEAVKAETGAEISHVEAKTPGEQEENLRAFASKKYHIVFAHGAEFEAMALKMESEFPNTQFIISSGRKVGKNTTPIILQLEDGAYLLGMLAAGMSKTGKIAAVGAMDIVPVKSVFHAFEAGAKAVNPDITVVPPVYTGSWDDPNKAKQQTLALLDQGADVIIQDVDAAAPGVYDAVKERNKPDKPIYALGTNSDQNILAPDVILASAPIYSDKAFVLIAKQVKEGKYTPSDTPFDMKSGVIDFILNPQIEAKIPAVLKTKIEEARKQITDGSLKVPKVSS
jgi:basic membrane protein A and related proteins